MKRDGLWKGAFWMAAVTLCSFFVPVLGGMVGGLAGGWRARGVRRALEAALLAAPIAAIGLWVLLATTPVPIAGRLTRAGADAWTLVSLAGLLAGAVIGGLAGADHQEDAGYRGRTISASGTA